jgi:hypothetical protein
MPRLSFTLFSSFVALCPCALSRLPNYLHVCTVCTQNVFKGLCFVNESDSKSRAIASPLASAFPLLQWLSTCIIETIRYSQQFGSHRC